MRKLALIVFIISFLHACLLMGFFQNIPIVGGALVKNMIQDNPNVLEYIPYQIYSGVGYVLWKAGAADLIGKNIYWPIVKETIRHRELRPLRYLLNLSLTNIVVLISLALFILLGFVKKAKKKQEDTPGEEEA